MVLDTKVQNPTNRDLRVFSIALCLILIAFGSWQLFLNRLVPSLICFTLAAIVVSLILFRISLMIPVYKVLLVISRAIGFVLTPIIFGVVFYFIFAPIGIALRLFRNDILDRKFNKKATSYWIERQDQACSQNSYERQY